MPKIKIKKHLKKSVKHLNAGAKHVTKAKRQAAKLGKKRVVKRKTGQKLLRAFFIVVAAVSTGSLAFTINTTKPTVDVEIRTNIAKAVDQLNPEVTQTSAGQVGQASWYALGLPAPDSLTCASTKYPRGTYLLVTSMRNGKNVICLVNDYGPQPWTNRVIDLSRGSFRQIEDLGRGTVPVEVRVVPKPPQSLRLPFPDTYHASVGYSACAHVLAAQLCEENRHQTRQF